MCANKYVHVISKCVMVMDGFRWIDMSGHKLKVNIYCIMWEC